MDNGDLPGWLTPEAAIAWICTRDKTFALKAIELSSFRLHIALGSWARERPQDNCFPFGTLHDAQKALSEKLGAGIIKAEGTHFQITGSLFGAHIEHTRPHGEVTARKLELIEDDAHGFHLRSSDGRQGYRDLSIDTAGLLREFPFSPAPAPAAATNGKRHRTAYRSNDVSDALAAKYPGGVPAGVTPKEAHAVVSKWLKQQDRAAVSRDTVRRTLEHSRSQSERK